MPYFTLTYDTVDDFVNRRVPHRMRHLTLVRDAHARGELVMAGALGHPPDGALLVFRAADRQVVETFARQDPYVIEGLVRQWHVRPWTVVVGYDPSEPPPAGLPGSTPSSSAST
ncbi:MAG TPA: YciI-like protein [Vicinamibacterales bacterium]|nr:YciI-like protein [Vicinamibacterales bacterium]